MTETPIQDVAQKSPAARSPRSHYVGALDGLRVLAILAVLVYHANPSWLPGGYFGVTVFFVLTGGIASMGSPLKLTRAM